MGLNDLDQTGFGETKEEKIIGKANQNKRVQGASSQSGNVDGQDITYREENGGRRIRSAANQSGPPSQSSPRKGSEHAGAAIAIALWAGSSPSRYQAMKTRLPVHFKASSATT